MPYIMKLQRDKILLGIPGQRMIDTSQIHLPGDLNYAITELLNCWLKKNGVNYTELNTLIGVLESAKLELYRRIAAPYEDKKIEESGDVY